MQQNTNQYSSEITVVNFYGEKIPTIKTPDGRIVVAIRNVIENMGLEWDYHRSKIVEAQSRALTEGTYDRFRAENLSVNIEGEEAIVLCIDLKRLNALLFSINANRIPDLETRNRVIRYQEECVVALHDYWMHGAAVNMRITSHDIDSGYKDARAFSRPALVAAVARVEEHWVKDLGLELDKEDLYNQMIGYAYMRCGINPVGISEKGPLGETTLDSGYLSLKLAFIEMSIVAVLNHFVAYNVNPEDLGSAVEEHVAHRLNEVGNEILQMADFVPRSLFDSNLPV